MEIDTEESRFTLFRFTGDDLESQSSNHVLLECIMLSGNVVVATVGSCEEVPIAHSKLTAWLMDPEGQCRIHKGSPIIPILSQIDPILCIDTYSYKVHSNIVLSSILRSP